MADVCVWASSSNINCLVLLGCAAPNHQARTRRCSFLKLRVVVREAKFPDNIKPLCSIQFPP